MTTDPPTTDRSEVIARRLAETPAEPGVYLMRDGDGRILYVGKARNLRKRLASYFKPSGHGDSRIGVLVGRIADFETVVTRTEKEALILESTLIKRHRPRYNVVLKDDKRYPSLRLNPAEDYPRFTVVRRIGGDDAQYFGPFASATAVRQTLKVLNKTFKLRQCKAGELRTRTRPCLHCQLNGCLAPCCRDVPRELYREQVEEAVLFLKGRTRELIRKVRDEMTACAAAQEYERAARLRDKLFALQRTTEKQVAVTTDFLDRDVFAAAAADGDAVITHLEVHGGFLAGTRHFSFSDSVASESEMLGHFIRQFYEGRAFVPGEVIVSHALEDAALVEEWLAAQRGRRVKVYRPERGEKARLLDMALHNAGAELERLPARREAGDLPERLQRRLGLSRAPRRIECADNSTLMGSEPVAGVVVFVDGRPETSAYRTYRIRTVNGPDDYAAMTEVLERRYRDAGGQGALPDLLMVDGGRGQLGVALAVMRELGLEGRFDVIGIAKKDERRGESRDKIFVPGRANPVAFGRDADALLFLQRVRDEAHRFAIAYHRRRRRRAALRSALDRLPGIGASRKAALIRHFRSFEAIRAATLEELSALPGFNLGLAEAVKAGLAAAAPAEDEPASTSASPEPP